jgi:hypothetical protein
MPVILSIQILRAVAAIGVVLVEGCPHCWRRPLLEYSKRHASWSFMKIALFKKAQQIPAISDADA